MNYNDFCALQPKKTEFVETAAKNISKKNNGLIDRHVRKIVIALDLVWKENFRNKSTGKVAINRITNAHLLKSLSTWMSPDDLETYSALFKHIGRIVESGQSGELHKTLSLWFNKRRKEAVESMLVKIESAYS